MNLSLGQRRRMLREINTEFDVIIDRIAQESGNNPKAFVGSCEMKYPLTAGSGIFKGKKPAAVIIGGECVAVRTWRQLVGEIMTRCISIPAYRIAPESLAGKVSGKKRGVLSCSRKARSCADPHTGSIRGRRLKRRLHAGIPNSTGLPTGAEVLLFRGSEKTAVPAGSSGKHRGFWSVRRISSCRQRSPFPRR